MPNAIDITKFRKESVTFLLIYFLTHPFIPFPTIFCPHSLGLPLHVTIV